MRRLVRNLAVWAVVIVFAPLIVLVGEPLSRAWHPMAAARRGRRTAQPGSKRFRARLVRNPGWIALTAPARWVRSTLLPSLGLRRRRRGWLPGGEEGLWPDAPPFLGGVREPRRPKPAPSAAGVALREPRKDLDRLREELMGEAAHDAVGRQRPRRTDAPVDQELSGDGLAASA